MFFRLASIALLISITACGSVSEVVAINTDTYLVSSHGVVGNGASSSEEVKAMQSASVFCQRKSLTLKVLKVEKVDPFFGRAPSASVQFQCAPNN
jgi:hypothetical protein